MNTLLAGRTDRPDLLVFPGDAARLGIADGGRVAVGTAGAGGGSVEATARFDPSIRPGVVSLPHGYDRPNIGDLTVDTTSVHPDYGMPTLAGVPVTVSAL